MKSLVESLNDAMVCEAKYASTTVNNSKKAANGLYWVQLDNEKEFGAENAIVAVHNGQIYGINAGGEYDDWHADYKNEEDFAKLNAILPGSTFTEWDEYDIEDAGECVLMPLMKDAKEAAALTQKLYKSHKF